jgi:nicotinamidase-related amidase
VNLIAAGTPRFKACERYDLQYWRMEDRSSALLIIDVQIGLVELVTPEVQSSILPKIKTLLPKARASEIAVIFIQHDSPKGHPLRPTQRAREFTLPSTLSVGGPSSESENQILFSRPNFKGNLEKEAVPTSSLLGE